MPAELASLRRHLAVWRASAYVPAMLSAAWEAFEHQAAPLEVARSSPRCCPLTARQAGPVAIAPASLRGFSRSVHARQP